MKALAVLLLAAAVLAACGTTAPEPAQPPGPAAELSFTTTTLEGDEFDGRSLHGKAAVLWFWAPWCVVCRSEAPVIGRMAKQYDGEVTVIGVAGRGKVPEMRRFAEETRLTGLTHLVDEDGDLWRRFGVVAQPAFAFVDPSGRVEVFGGSLPEDDLDARIRALT